MALSSHFDFSSLAALKGLCGEDSTVSVSVNTHGIEVMVHGPLGRTLWEAAGAVPSGWYALEPTQIGQTEARPQRHYRWEADGVRYVAIEAACEIGLSVEDCIAQNEAAKAAKSEAA